MPVWGHEDVATRNALESRQSQMAAAYSAATPAGQLTPVPPSPQ